MDSPVVESPIWTTHTSATNTINNINEDHSKVDDHHSPTSNDQLTETLPRKQTPPSSNLHDTLMKSLANANGASASAAKAAPSVASRKSSSSSSPTSSVASSRITAINLHHHNNLLAGKKTHNLANMNGHHGSSASLWQQQQQQPQYHPASLSSHNLHNVAPFGSGINLHHHSTTKELLAASVVGGSTITLQASERAASVAGRDTPFSFLSSLPSTNRLNCLGGSSPVGPGDQSPLAAYFKHHQLLQHQQQQQHNSVATYPHSYNGGGSGGMGLGGGGGNGGGGGGGCGNNSNGGGGNNQKVNI